MPVVVKQRVTAMLFEVIYVSNNWLFSPLFKNIYHILRFVKNIFHRLVNLLFSLFLHFSYTSLLCKRGLVFVCRSNHTTKREILKGKKSCNFKIVNKIFTYLGKTHRHSNKQKLYDTVCPDRYRPLPAFLQNITIPHSNRTC